MHVQADEIISFVAQPDSAGSQQRADSSSTGDDNRASVSSERSEVGTVGL